MPLAWAGSLRRKHPRLSEAGIILALYSFWAISYGPNISKLIIAFPAPPLKFAVWMLSFSLAVAFFIAFIRFSVGYISYLDHRDEFALMYATDRFCYCRLSQRYSTRG
jgi:hypothetical protein